MRNRVILSLAICAFFAGALHARAQAIPIFAQRYHLRCDTCHSVLPELNAFGRSFREHGYRLPIPKHGTTVAALRYQMEYEKTPAAGMRRFTPGGVLLSNVEVGAIDAFVHYNLGAGGGPSGAYLAYLATYDKRSHTLYRAGLFELPLAQSPGQRLDDLAGYGYYTAHVGLNDLSLASPRWGLQVERTYGSLRADYVVDFGEFKGAAYGGKPINTGEITGQASPEAALFLRTPINSALEIGGAVISGSRDITPSGRPSFTDTYRRYDLLAHLSAGRFDVQAEQWFGNDLNADGFGTDQFSSGGYVRAKYYPTPHAYVGVRYDAAATPFLTRDYVLYGAFMVNGHARVLLQDVLPVGGGKPAFGAALTLAIPWPRGY